MKRSEKEMIERMDDKKVSIEEIERSLMSALSKKVCVKKKE